ncbi:MAG TPA: tRNA pseudouridine(55) synthase TruB [Acidobacteriaceae bacterium]|nr:tRNA pseudouridine(55) synthase TruB [Acidobacteriaceae bacterium]
MNGLLVVDKSGGMTSHDVVSRVRRLTGEKSVGHLGTLDPMATGVLPLVLGKYTRLAQFFSLADKTYTGTIRFGFATDTYDAEGEVAGVVVAPTLMLEQVREAALPFHGEIEQMPPAYSAKKIGGKPAYKLAREGKPVELKAKTIVIHEFSILGLDGDTASFQMKVSAGGYVRSVAHELGQALGCGAHLSGLRRTVAGAFSLEQAWTLEALGELGPEIERAMVHPRTLLPEMPCVGADTAALGKLRNGGQANLAEFSDAGMVKVFAGQRELVAVAKRVAGTLFQPVIVMG